MALFISFSQTCILYVIAFMETLETFLFSEKYFGNVLEVGQHVTFINGLMVNVLAYGWSGLAGGHCFVFFDKTLLSRGASFHPGPGCSKAG